MIEIGHLNQKASTQLVVFVFGCIAVIIVILNILNKAEYARQEVYIIYEVGQFN